MSTSPCYEPASKFGGADSLRLELTPACFYLLPYHHLDMAKCESDKGGDTLTLSFLNRTVRMTGKNLRELAIQIQRRNVESVKPMPDKYGLLANDDVWIKTVEIEGPEEPAESRG
jgi:hypothetical protein